MELTLLSPDALPWIVAVGVAAGVGVWLGGLDARRGRRRRASLPATRSADARTGRGPWSTGRTGGEAQPNTQTAMLACVVNAAFKPQRLLNQAERRVLAALDAALADHAPDWRAMAQVNLGEILTSPDDRAYRAINAKRVDLLVVDERGWPMVAIEYQGSGHYLSGDACIRDAVKREALRRAGIAMAEVLPDHDDADIVRIVCRARALAQSQAAARHPTAPRPDPTPGAASRPG